MDDDSDIEDEGGPGGGAVSRARDEVSSPSSRLLSSEVPAPTGSTGGILSVLAFAADALLGGDDWREPLGRLLERLVAATGITRGHVVLRAENAESPPEIWSRGEDRSGFERDDPRGRLNLWLTGSLDKGPRAHPTSEVPEPLRETLRRAGVERTTVVPIRVENRGRGALVLEEGGVERTWSAGERDGLTVVARLIAGALERSDHRHDLEESERRFHAFLIDAPELILSLSPQGVILWVNREAARLFESERRSLEGRSILSLVPPDHHDLCLECLEEVRGGAATTTVEAHFLTAGGKEVPVEGRVSPHVVGGEVLSIHGIFRDISERRQVDRMKQQFLSVVSHELRTPLTSIIASLALLRGGRVAPGSEKGGPLVDVAYRNSSRLLQLVNDLLDLQKLSAGKMGFALEGIPCRGFLQEVLDEMWMLADSRNVSLELESDPELVVRADRDRLFQVVSNLLSNAIKFSPPGEAILVGASGVEEGIAIVVVDRGPGIPPELQNRLFDEFTQLDSSPTRRVSGSGLGLSIVKALTEAMEGSVTLRSESGEGTRVTVTFPRG